MLFKELERWELRHVEFDQTRRDARRRRPDLERRGFAEWDVETVGPFGRHDCPSPTIDRTRRVVVLIGIR